MKGSPTRALSILDKLYNTLLYLYPTEHREAYGQPMSQVFWDMCRDAQHRQGQYGLFKVLVQIVIDTLNNTVKEHLDKKGFNLMGKLPTHISRYEIKKLIGKGSMANVYHAHDPDREIDVAIKSIPAQYLQTSDHLDEKTIRELHFNEIELLKNFDHPGIPKCHDHGEENGDLFLVYDLINGKDLDEIVTEEDGFLPVEDVIDWGIQICDILRYMHEQKEPIIFRDTKPSNFMLDNEGKVHILDFGIAHKTGEGLLKIGTKGFSSPEQYRGDSFPPTDIFAMGASLHHLLTKRDPRKEEPFTFDTAPARSLNPSVSEELEGVLMKATQYNPEDRYQSIREMRTALESCL